MEINKLVRKNILNLTPYKAARHLVTGSATFLDANENPYDTGYNRYPDPWQKELKEELSKRKGIETSEIFLGNGSDEPIDLLMRVFCEPGKDNIVLTPPTYGMYEVSANINNVEIKEAPLNDDFSLNIDRVLETSDENSKLLFLCSPNNPSSNLMDNEAIEEIIKKFHGIVVIDEAYIDFADSESWIKKINKYDNLVILQTLSKAYGLAALRIGLCIANPQILEYLNRIKPPYNISSANQKETLSILKEFDAETYISKILSERESLREQLEDLPFIQKVFPSDANFLLVKVDKPHQLINYVRERGIIIRDRSTLIHCDGCVRITIGTKEENENLINNLIKYAENLVY